MGDGLDLCNNHKIEHVYYRAAELALAGEYENTDILRLVIALVVNSFSFLYSAYSHSKACCITIFLATFFLRDSHLLLHFLGCLTAMVIPLVLY